MTITHDQRFPVEIGNSPEPLPNHQHNIDTADLWAVHLRCGNGAGSVGTNAGLLLQSGLQGLTGYMVGGDSWAEWAEPATPSQDTVLHVYFTTDKPDHLQAWVQGTVIAHAVGITSDTNYAVSTGADWAEQINWGQCDGCGATPDRPCAIGCTGIIEPWSPNRGSVSLAPPAGWTSTGTPTMPHPTAGVRRSVDTCLTGVGDEYDTEREVAIVLVAWLRHVYSITKADMKRDRRPGA